MTEVLNQAITLMRLENSGIESKICGRRNWVIVYDKNRVRFAGGFGEAERRGMLSWSLEAMVQNEICIRYFTYKKDFLAALGLMGERKIS